MIKILFAVFLFCTCAAAQIKFEVKSASKLYDVRIEVEGCEDKICEGPVTYTLLKKNHLSPFQVFKLPDTSFMLVENDQPSANITRLDQQSAVSFSDYDFDGIQDLAFVRRTERRLRSAVVSDLSIFPARGPIYSK